MDRRIDIVVAAAFAAIGLIVIISATGIKQGMVRDPIGPRAAFYLCGGVMLAGGLWVVAGHLARWARETRDKTGHIVRHEGVADEAGYDASALRAWALIGLCLAYAAAFAPLGFLFATPAFLFCGLLLLGKRGALALTAIPLTFTTIAYLVFAGALGVRLPVGPLTGLFRDLGWITL